MVNFGKLVKLARGSLGQDELAELLAAMGMELTFAAVEPKLETFRPVAAAASLPGAKLLELKGKMKDGGLIHALLVMNQQSQ